MSVKGFSDRQKPVAIGSIILVVAVMICILAFGKTTTLPKAEESTSATVEKEKTTEATTEETTTEYKRETTTASAYTTAGRGAVIVQGDRIMEAWGLAPKSLETYSKDISTFAKKVPNANVYVLVAPTSIEFYGPEEYHTEGRSQRAGLDIVYNALEGDNVFGVDVYKELERYVDSEYIYFKTDHHWTARGAYHAYKIFADVAGFEATKLEDHETGKLEGFYGSLYSYGGSVIGDKPDYVEWFKPLTNTTAKYWNASTMDGEGTSFNVVDPDRILKGNIGNKYLCFIAGDNAIEKITTEANTGRKIVVIKESYGNAFTPFLCDNFDEVYVLDPRKVELDLRTFVKTNEITDILFINYMFAPTSPAYKDPLNKLLGI